MIPKGGDVLVELVLERICSKKLASCSYQMRQQILPDTTPVPFFGDFASATYLTIGLNPSSVEFPGDAAKRRLVHLADLGLESDYYQLGKSDMNSDQANTVKDGLLNYFQLNPYEDWFKHAELAIRVGLDASYYQNVGKRRACHTDIFPWATKQFSSLAKDIQVEFMAENANFLRKVMTNNQFEAIVVFGSSTKDLLLDELDIDSHVKIESKGPFSSKFEMGDLLFSDSKILYFFTSQGPSVQYKNDQQKETIHKSFGEFMRQLTDA